MSRKPAATSGDGAAGRSLFRSSKTSTKASGRQESDQLTRPSQQQPASDAERVAVQSDGPAPELGSDLALAPVADPRNPYGFGNFVPPLSELDGDGNELPLFSVSDGVGDHAPLLAAVDGDLAPPVAPVLSDLAPTSSLHNGANDPAFPPGFPQIVGDLAPPFSGVSGDLAPHSSLSDGDNDPAFLPPLSHNIGNLRPSLGCGHGSSSRDVGLSQSLDSGYNQSATAAAVSRDVGDPAPTHPDQSRPGSVTSNIDGDFDQSDQDFPLDQQVVLRPSGSNNPHSQVLRDVSNPRSLAMQSPFVEVLANVAEKAKAALDLALLSHKVLYSRDGEVVSFENEAEARRIRALDTQYKTAVKQLEEATEFALSRQRKVTSSQVPGRNVPVVAHLHGPHLGSGNAALAPSQTRHLLTRAPAAPLVAPVHTRLTQATANASARPSPVQPPSANARPSPVQPSASTRPTPVQPLQVHTQRWTHSAGSERVQPHQAHGQAAVRPIAAALAPTALSESQMVYRFDADERQAIRTAHDVGEESRSEDSQTRSVDENGYWHGDGFAVGDDDDDGDSLSSGEDTSTDDDSCTEEEGEDEDPRETNLERKHRMELILAELSKMEKKAKARGQDTFSYSADESRLPELCKPNVRIGRRTHRTTLVKLIINSWLTGDVRQLDLQQVSEFLRLVSLHKPEYAISIFYVLIKRIMPVSFTLFKFLYRCITRYTRSLKRTFKDARLRLQAKDNKQLAKSKSKLAGTPDMPVAAQVPSQHLPQLSKPVLKPPTLKDVTNIADVVGRFYNEYRAYSREQRACKLTARTMFQCLDADQAATLAAMSQHDEEELDAMDSEALLEIWRATFGLQSSAAVLRACNRLPFNGNTLDLVAWSDWSRRFRLVVAQAPLQNLPPPKELAKVFVLRCQDSFLSSDVLANEPGNLDVALRLVMQRLNDSGFLMSHHVNSQQARQQQQQQQDRDVPIKLVRRDGHGGGGG